jgi:hypothetical protein
MLAELITLSVKKKELSGRTLLRINPHLKPMGFVIAAG